MVTSAEIADVFCTASEAADARAEDLVGKILAKSQYLCSDEETEAVPAKSVHRSGNQQATMVTLLKRTGRILPGFSY